MMAKGNKTNFLTVALALFVFFAPVLGSGAEKTPVIYSSLFVFSAALIFDIYKTGRIIVTKSFLFCTLGAVFAFVQMLWVSDKGAQFALAALFLLGAFCALAAASYKDRCAQSFNDTLKKTVYASALFCAVAAILYQIFIESRFWGCNMDFGNGSATGTAVLVVVGIITWLHLFKNKKKQTGMLAGIVILGYVFIMSKSLPAYLLAAVLCLVYNLNKPKKRLEAFLALMATVALGAVNLIVFAADAIKNKEQINAAFTGLINIAGVGCGGYNARVAVVDGGYAGFGGVLNVLCESMGIIFLAAVVLLIVAGALYYRKNKTLFLTVVFFSAIVLLFASSASLVYSLPFIAMLFAVTGKSTEIRLKPYWACLPAAPMVFFLVLALSYAPYAMGQNAMDTGKYIVAANRYVIGARMEMFSAHGWEKAYNAACKAGESGADNELLQRHCIEKAIKFNKKNYGYRRMLADTYTREGRYSEALEVWEGIMERYDREYLYPMYAEKMYDVMANCPVGLEKTEELYQKMTDYARKAQDKQIKLEVNNILAKSQQHYISAREGAEGAAEMYAE